MHELSIALSIVDLASETLEQNGGGSVQTIFLRLGSLSGVTKEALQSAYELAVENTPLARARLAIEEVPVEIECHVCRQPQRIASMQEMRCPVCGTFSADVVRGRDLEVTAMEISDEQPAPTH